EDLAEDRADAVGAGLAQEVEGAVLDARVVAPDLVGVANVGLAHLDEATTAGEDFEGRIDELAREGVQHDVDALAIRRRQEAVTELQVPRGGDVVVVEP